MACLTVTFALIVLTFVESFVPRATLGGSTLAHHRTASPSSLWQPPTPESVMHRDVQIFSAPEESSTEESEAVESGAEESEADVWARMELPMSKDQQVQQATSAVWKALSDGKTRQVVRLSLPLIGPTEMDDWPGGDKQRYEACGPMTRALLLGLPPAQEGGKVEEQILDESDAVGLMQLQCSQAKDDVAALIFPTTEDLSLVEQVAGSAGSRLVAIVNPGWKEFSDFGFFGAGQAKKVLSDYQLTYRLKSLVCYGYTLRLLYSYPGPWRLFLLDETTGAKEVVGSWEEKPTNDDIQKTVFAKKGKPNPVERVQSSAKFFQDGM